FRDERLCFLSYDDEHHRLALINVPGLAPRNREHAGTDHVAYSYRDLGELLSTYRRLKTAGITPHWPINHGVTTSLYYLDPDNNRCVLKTDILPPPAELDVFSRSGVFPETPGGATAIGKGGPPATRGASRWPICCASRHCPKARRLGIC